MSEIKCPFCGQELETGGVDGVLRGCPKCRNLGTEMLWQELIKTHKQLEVAIEGIKYMRNNCLEYAADYMDKADDTLEQIKKVGQEKG